MFDKQFKDNYRIWKMHRREQDYKYEKGDFKFVLYRALAPFCFAAVILK